ncbi:MAG: carbohydrate ABC transporter permease [Lachnospiraceae bacterium]
MKRQAKKSKKSRIFHSMGVFLLCVFAGIVWLPIFLLAVHSLDGQSEIVHTFGAVLCERGTTVKFHLFPNYPTLRGYVELLLDSPGFFVMFWNSCKQVLLTLLGQLIVGVPAGFAFARYEFPGKKGLFYLYMLLMILPFQVTMVSDYFVLNNMHLLDTQAAVILPGIFATFSVFLITKAFRNIPTALFEAAAVDGAGEFQIFIHIALPMAKPGIFAAMILSFIENWNAMEPAMTFLKDPQKWPLSLYLPSITTDTVSVAFCASVIMLLPAVLLFLWGQTYLEQGIAASGLKE